MNSRLMVSTWGINNEHRSHNNNIKTKQTQYLTPHFEYERENLYLSSLPMRLTCVTLANEIRG